MYIDFNLFSSACDYNLPISSSYVILYNTENGSLKIRDSKELGKIKIKQAIKDQTPVKDPRKANCEKVWTVVFTGSKNAANKLIEDSKKRVENGMSSESESVRQTRSSSSNSLVSNDLISLLNTVKNDQRKIQKSIGILEDENKAISRKLDEIMSKNNKENKRLTLSDGAEIIRFITAEVAKARANYEDFNKALQEIKWEKMNLSSTQQTKIIEELKWEKKVSKMVSNIAALLYGDDLETHLLGRHGKRERTPRQSERPATFSKHQEEKLRDCLSVFGEILLNDRAWKSVVQYHVNQKGRDVKKAKKRPIYSATDSSEDDSDDERTRKKQKRTGKEKEDGDPEGIKSAESDANNSDNGQKNNLLASQENENENSDTQ